MKGDNKTMKFLNLLFLLLLIVAVLSTQPSKAFSNSYVEQCYNNCSSVSVSVTLTLTLLEEYDASGLITGASIYSVVESVDGHDQITYL
jgi:hypothetical protein